MVIFFVGTFTVQHAPTLVRPARPGGGGRGGPFPSFALVPVPYKPPRPAAPVRRGGVVGGFCPARVGLGPRPGPTFPPPPAPPSSLPWGAPPPPRGRGRPGGGGGGAAVLPAVLLAGTLDKGARKAQARRKAASG